MTKHADGQSERPRSGGEERGRGSPGERSITRSETRAATARAQPSLRRSETRAGGSPAPPQRSLVPSAARREEGRTSSAAGAPVNAYPDQPVARQQLGELRSADSKTVTTSLRVPAPPGQPAEILSAGLETGISPVRESLPHFEDAQHRTIREIAADIANDVVQLNDHLTELDDKLHDADRLTGGLTGVEIERVATTEVRSRAVSLARHLNELMQHEAAPSERVLSLLAEVQEYGLAIEDSERC